MILIRCDSSHEIGTGHVFRCLALADQVSKRGETVEFVCKDLPGKISQQIPYKVHLLKASEKNETESIKKLAPVGSWLILDHYQLDENFEKPLKDHFRIFVIDDLFNRPHDCDFLLDQNAVNESVREKYRKLTPASTQLLLGPCYSLLREEFRLQSKKPAEISKRNGRVLVFFGGADSRGEMVKFVEAAIKAKTNLGLDLLVSKSHQHLEKLQALQLPANIKLHIAPPVVSKLMQESTLYFGSGGTVTWERMALGLPGVIVSVAENQAEIAQSLDDLDQQIYLGPSEKISYENALKKIEGLLKDLKWLQKTSDLNQKLVRPFPSSLIKALFSASQSGLHLRLARPQDARWIFDLRNDPTVRSMSKESGELRWEEHLKWFENALGREKMRIYIAEMDGKACGQFRVSANLETSVMITSELRGKGLAAEIIRKGSQIYCEEFPAVTLKAYIKLDNPASRKGFEKAGYKKQSEEKRDGSVYDLLLFHMLVDQGQ